MADRLSKYAEPTGLAARSVDFGAERMHENERLSKYAKQTELAVVSVIRYLFHEPENRLTPAP